jgi:hypothetical protein
VTQFTYKNPSVTKIAGNAQWTHFGKVPHEVHMGEWADARIVLRLRSLRSADPSKLPATY